MGVIGATVIIKSTKMLGTMMGWSSTLAGFVEINAWDPDKYKYIMYTVHPMNVEEIKNPLVLSQTNGDDEEMDEWVFQANLDLALQTKDKEWFDALMEQKNKPKQPRELSPEEKRAIRVGSVVCDLKGLNVGIVVARCKYYDDQVIVQTWSPSLNKYLEFRKRLDLLKPVESPQLLDWVNGMANYKDERFRESLKAALSELALQTHDKEWFEELNKKETSDGA